MNRARFTFLLFVAVLASASAVAQTNVNEEQGLKPYDAWHGGDLDSISMTNGGLSLHIPLVSFPQRGNLDLSFAIYASSKQWRSRVNSVECNNPNDPNGCTPYWIPMIRGLQQPQFGSVPIEGAYVTSSLDWIPDNECNFVTGNPDNGIPSEADWVAGITAPDGDVHFFGSGSTVNGGGCPNPPYRALDASGILQSDATTFIMPNGTHFNFPTNGNPSFVHANGNTITLSSNSYTDTLGRVVSVPFTTPANLDSCPAGSASGKSWTIPGLAAGTRTFKACYSNINIYTSFGSGGTEYGPGNNLLLTAVLLPDLTAWTFSYDHWGNITRVGFPTGGSISYTFAGGPITCGADTPMSMVVTSRTVDANDGTGGHTWTYSYAPPIMVVTDPSGNDTVHTIVDPTTGQAGCTLVDTQVQYYQGSHTTGTLLKTVATQYSFAPNTLTTPGSGATAINIVPHQVTVTLQDGHSSRVVNTWDNTITESPYGTTVPIVLGSLLQKDEYDFSNTLVRSTLNRYLWQDNAPYLPINFVQLKSSVILKDGAGNQIAQTGYGYDDVSRIFSYGNTVGQGAAPAGSARGNLNYVNRWLNTNNTLITTTTNVYDTGLPYQTIDPLGNTTTFSYSTSFHGAYLTQTNMPDTGSPAVHHAISGNYDFNTGLLTSFTDENNQQYTYTYEGLLLRLTEGDHPDGGKTLFTHPDPLTITRQRLITTTPAATYDSYTVKFDGLGRPIQTQQVTPSGTVLVDTTYDAIGRVATVSNPYFQRSNYSTDPTYGVTSTEYDALNRTTRTTKQDGNFTAVTYSGVCITNTDEAGKSRKSCDDALGRMTTVYEDPSGLNYETDYQYDLLNNLLRVDQKGSAPADSTQWRTRLFAYDSLSRLLTANNPESGTISYAYDVDGNVTFKTDARGVVASYAYDALNRLTQKSYSDGTTSSAYFSYDTVPAWGVPLTNTIGRLTWLHSDLTGPRGASIFGYDAMGRVIANNQCVPSNCGSGSYAVNATYDLVGNMTSLTYPSGRRVAFQFNSASQLNQVQFTAWQGVSQSYNPYTYWSTPDTNFYPSAAPKSATLGSGIVESYQFNSRLQPTRDTVAMPSITTFADHVYNYGTQNNGNISSVADQLGSAYTQTFTYDTLNRLATATESRWGLSYVFDAWGNNLQQNVTSGSALQHQYVAAANNRLNGFTYDAAGNMLADSLHQYIYDAENRIKSVDTTGATYLYDATGARVRKDTASNYTEYIYFGGAPIAERDQAGNWSDYIYANGKRVAKATSFEHQIHISGQECANCGWQWYQFNFTNLGALAGRTIQPGDSLRWTQWSNNGSKGGIIMTYTDGTDSCCSSAPVIVDQNGEDIGSGSLSNNQWEYRTASLSSVAGKYISQIRLYAHGNSPPGQWDIYFQDLVYTAADGTVIPLFSQNPTLPGLSGFGSTGMTSTSATIHDCTGSGCAPINTTTYYHGDQVGSSRLLTNGRGYPVWQGTFLPFGEEYNPQLTTNHYKFTGKERDTESNLDYFGARYYSSTLGRFMTPDWAAKPTTVPYAKFGDPQSLNLYSYVENGPLNRVDADGHYWAGMNGLNCDLSGAFSAPGVMEVDSLEEGTEQQAAQREHERQQQRQQAQQRLAQAFDRIWNAFPDHQTYSSSSQTPGTSGQSIQQLTGMDEKIVYDTCALRLSYALNQAGFKITKHDGKSAMRGKDGQYYLVGQADVARFVARKFSLSPQTLGKSGISGFAQAAGQTSGFVRFSIQFNDPHNTATGHIALFKDGVFREPDHDDYTRGSVHYTVQSIDYLRMK